MMALEKDGKSLRSYEEIHKDTSERKEEIIRNFRSAALRGRGSNRDNQAPYLIFTCNR
ncbi:MAG: hypothetical protein CEO40_196 [Parcubacteria group bacterium LiPW_72]|nr:MAG: hypothetical protein CEO40_196 [Parcubacteria group bacterium LiPW_72]